MPSFSEAITARMAGDATLVALLGQYQDGPSILTIKPVPAEARRPVAVAHTIVSDIETDFLVQQGRDVIRDVAVYGVAPDHHDEVRDAAERIRALFHRQRFAFDGYYATHVIATGPIDAPSEPGEVGRVVTLLFRLRAA